MIFYFLSFIGISSVYMLFKIEANKTIYNETLDLYRRWKNLNSLVSTRHSNYFKIVINSFWILSKSLYIQTVQYMDTTVKQIDAKNYEITYVINGKLYKMIITPIRGPAPLLQVRDEKDDDITEKILPYLGPRHDWHGCKFTPKNFGYEKITFELADGTNKSFKKNDNLTI